MCPLRENSSWLRGYCGYFGQKKVIRSNLTAEHLGNTTQAASSPVVLLIFVFLHLSSLSWGDWVKFGLNYPFTLVLVPFVQTA